MRSKNFHFNLGVLNGIAKRMGDYHVFGKKDAQALEDVIEDLEDAWDSMMDYEPQKDEEDIEENV